MFGATIHLPSPKVGPPRRLLAIVALALALGGLAGCRVPCDADEKASPAQLAREQKAMYRGQPICRPLLAPELTVGPERLALHAVKDVELADAELGPRLALYREHFRAVRAGEPYDATLTVTIPPATPRARALALFAAAGKAGVKRLHVVSGGAIRDVTVGRARADAPVPAGATIGEVLGGLPEKTELGLLEGPGGGRDG